MSNLILEEKYYKMSFKALPLKYSGQKNRQKGKGGGLNLSKGKG